MPPGKNMDDLWTILRSGMWRLWYKLSSEGKKRFYSEFMPLLHETKHHVMGDRDDDSYYLVYLGSKPSARGKGYAKKLIEDMTAKVFPYSFIYLCVHPISLLKVWRPCRFCGVSWDEIKLL